MDHQNGNPDCPLCHGYGIIVERDDQKQAPACPRCFPASDAEKLKYQSPPSPRLFTLEERNSFAILFAEWMDNSDYTSDEGKWFKIICNPNSPTEYKEISADKILEQYLTTIK